MKRVFVVVRQGMVEKPFSSLQLEGLPHASGALQDCKGPRCDAVKEEGKPRDQGGCEHKVHAVQHLTNNANLLRELVPQ